MIRTARSTGYEPNHVQIESGTTFMSISDGDDEDLMGFANVQLGQAKSSPCLEDDALQMARRDLGAVHQAAQRNIGFGQFQVLQQGHPLNTQHLIHDVRDQWKIKIPAESIRKCCPRTSTESS